MKTIFRSFLTIAGLLTLGSLAFAQAPYQVENGIAYNKSVSDKPNANGEYTITLETFVTGEVATRMKAIPSDIVLVLDVSGSMDDSVYSYEDAYVPVRANTSGNGYNQGYRYSNSNRWGENELEQNKRYYKYGEQYVQVRNGRTYDTWPNPSYYYLYFTVDGDTYYLDDESITTTMPTKYTSNNSDIWNGPLYQHKTRQDLLDALKLSVYEFIDIVKANDETLELGPDDIGNQISIVKFAGTQSTGLNEGDDRGYTQVVKQFKPVRTNSEELKNAVGKFIANGATSVDYGLTKAYNLLTQQAPPAYNEKGEHLRSRTVVVFTDGEPTHGSNFDVTVARDAVNTAKNIKATSGNNPGYATVFSVGVFPSNIDDRVDDYMEHMSSNYPDASASTSGNSISYTGTRLEPETVNPPKQCIYYQEASDADPSLRDVFETIATHSQGQNTAVGDESLLTLDVVSSSFTVPDGADLSKVKVYTAQCLGSRQIDGKEYLMFAEPVEAEGRAAVAHLWCRRLKTDESGKNPGEEGYVETFEWYDKGGESGIDIDAGLNSADHKKIDATTNAVSITGFNFSDNWCGYDENDAARGENKNTVQYTSEDPNYQYHKEGYRGFKLIIEFPITLNEEAVGGPSVKTNMPGSGIYLTENGEKVGEPLVTFNQPDVKIPVNIWVKKYGLEMGESAKFTVERKAVNNPSASWEPYATILITGTGETELVEGKEVLVSPTYKMEGLSYEYYYRVAEEGWAWSYTQSEQTDTTTETLLENPMIFGNVKKNTSVKHAESKAINEFGVGYNATMVDSRGYFKYKE